MNFIAQRILKITSLLMIPTLIIGNTTQLLAEVPHSAKILEIVGANSIDIRRRNGQLAPVSMQTVLRTLDRLNVPYVNGSIFASLEFLNQANQSMGLKVQASVKNKLRTSYYFPCEVDTKDTFIIEWENTKTEVRGCEKGIKVRSTDKKNAIHLNDNLSTMVASYPLIGQSRIQEMQYCTVVNSQGKSWLGFSPSSRYNPCQKPLKECEATRDKNCQTLTLDSWLTDSTEFTGIIACENQQKSIFTGLGNTMKDQIKNQWEQAMNSGALGCSLQVIGTGDILVEPSQKALNRVQINGDDTCLTSFVYEGTVNIKSVKRPDGRSYSKGQTYRYCGDDQTERESTFNPQDESIDMQVFLAEEKGYQFCNREQDAGGSEIKTRTIQMTATEGEIRINYEMYQIPDQLILTYEGKQLLDTGFISGNGTLSIPFSGKSGRVTVQMIGNDDDDTEWNYTLFCPR